MLIREWIRTPTHHMKRYLPSSFTWVVCQVLYLKADCEATCKWFSFGHHTTVFHGDNCGARDHRYFLHCLKTNTQNNMLPYHRKFRRIIKKTQNERYIAYRTRIVGFEIWIERQEWMWGLRYRKIVYCIFIFRYLIWRCNS